MVKVDKRKPKENVFFMLRERIRGYDLRSNDKLTFKCQACQVTLEREFKLEKITSLKKVEMQLESFSGIGDKEEDNKNDLILTAISRRKVNHKNFESLRDLINGKIKPELSTVEFEISVSRSFAPFATLKLSDFDRLRDLVTTVKTVLDDAAGRTFRLLRWRTNGSGSYNHHGGCTYYFSFDFKEWHALPVDSGVFLDVTRYITATSNITKEIERSVDNGLDEPVGLSLFREAWRLRQSSPRSSIVMGVAAAEIALKECIRTLQPETLWLLENIPSPPMVKILIKYLPILPIKVLANGKLPLPPNSVIKDIEKGVQIRNELVHTGKNIPNDVTIGEILFSIEDMLWILEACKGHEWALEYIRVITKNEMGLVQGENY